MPTAASHSLLTTMVIAIAMATPIAVHIHARTWGRNTIWETGDAENQPVEESPSLPTMRELAVMRDGSTRLATQNIHAAVGAMRVHHGKAKGALTRMSTSVREALIRRCPFHTRVLNPKVR
ncbi:hypothetical protein GCM10009604_05800 [Corynebacterium aurimucosum]